MDTEGILIVDGPYGFVKSNPFLFLTKPQPEFNLNTHKFVLGGFGALAHPTSFHHPDVRFMRKSIYDLIVPQLRKIYPGKKISMMFDRLSQRWEGDSISGETYHRDICECKRPGDIILGGWINLDVDQYQHFHCVPGTHNDTTDARGFSKLKDQKEYKATEKVYSVGPGQIIMFHQNLVHRIKPGKIKKNSIRMYIGWLITTYDTPVIDYTDAIQTQGIPRIPSGQLPPMYAKLHWVCHKQKVLDISTTVNKKLIDPKNNIVYRFLPSLLDSGLRMWPAYDQSDIDIFKPI